MFDGDYHISKHSRKEKAKHFMVAKVFNIGEHEFQLGFKMTVYRQIYYKYMVQVGCFDMTMQQYGYGVIKEQVSDRFF